MGSDPLVWFCRPVANGIWAQETDSAFGAFTPCALDSVVGNASHIVLIGLCLYRVMLIKINPKVQRYCLRSNLYNYVLALLACCCASAPLYNLVMGVSIFNFDKDLGLAPFEVCNFFIIMVVGDFIYFFIFNMDMFIFLSTSHFVSFQCIWLNVYIPIISLCTE